MKQSRRGVWGEVCFCHTVFMNIQRLLQHLAITVYIAMTVGGLSYTLFRYVLPGVPHSVLQFSYGMMAPYQTYRTFNEDLTAHGMREDGVWERINLDEYLPFLRGERAMRSYLMTFRIQGERVLYTKYSELAEQIQRLERARGRDWKGIQLTLEKWPMSPAGYEYLHQDPFIETEFLIQIP